MAEHHLLIIHRYAKQSITCCRGPIKYPVYFFSGVLHIECPVPTVMLRAGIRWDALFLSLILSAVVKTSANPDIDPEAQGNVVTRPSSEDSSKATCTRIEKALSSASQVFYPGTGSSHSESHLSQVHNPTDTPKIRLTRVPCRHCSLGQLKLSSVCLFCGAWNGP